jgi:hypothetical protein
MTLARFLSARVRHANRAEQSEHPDVEKERCHSNHCDSDKESKARLVCDRVLPTNALEISATVRVSRLW